MVDIGTPHIAGYSLDGKVAGMIMIYQAVCQHFGLEAKWSAEDFLPESAIAKLKVDPSSADEQQVISGAVKRVYDISRDDRRLRGILKVHVEKRGEFFDSLRNNYPVRREFQNTKALVKNRCSSLANKLNGIGFLLESTAYRDTGQE